MNMKKILLFLTLLTGMLLSGCNDSFLEKYPVTSLTQENAFRSYDNFKAFMWPCYGMFSNTTIATSITDVGRSSHYLGDVYAGFLNQRGASSQNKYAFQTVTNATSGNFWKVSLTKRVVSSESRICLACFFSVLMKLRESYHTAPFINEATIIDDKRSP